MKRRQRTALVAAALLGALAFNPSPASAAVSSTPAATPQLGTSGTDGSVEQVRQIVQCGGTMYAVGHFSQVKNGGSSALIPRNNAFAFSATAPYRVTGWNPNVNGQVNSAACAPDGTILLGGTFSTAGGAAVRNLAKVDAGTGAARSFATRAAGAVQHLEVVQGHLLVGGYFSGSLMSLSPATGGRDGYGLPAISGSYDSTGRSSVYNMSPSPSGRSVILSGTFTSVGGQHHEQLVRLDLTSGAATVNRWEPTELEQTCRLTFFARDAAWSPDETKIYTATTGYKLAGSSTRGPRTGPCDAMIAYPTTAAAFSGHLWLNYTGCDSYYSVAADASTVFAGGHQRWVSNPQGCDAAGPGAIPQTGLAEFDPATGNYQPGPDRGRGWGADDLLRTPAGLWVASDNFAGTVTCAGQSGHSGICFLPN